MANEGKTRIATGTKFFAALFSIIGVAGFFICNSYPYRIDYIQEANLDKFTILTLASLLAGIICGAVALRLSSQKRFQNGGLWIGISAIGLVAMFSDPQIGIRSVLTAQNICINNQRKIEAAKAVWAQQTGATNGTEITWNNLTPYFTNGFPKCPEGGTYILGKIGEPVLCSITNHLLPPEFR
ncbi:MAG: hypothetical protein ABSG87_07320 [Verrucomicrobiota bacterium]|jgi:hypothetical protein